MVLYSLFTYRYCSWSSSTIITVNTANNPASLLWNPRGPRDKDKVTRVESFKAFL